MLDKETLSKQKYIYCVYAGRDDNLNVERFPVIYINNHYVYFKKPGNEQLNSLTLPAISDSLDSLDLHDINSLRFCHKYFWNIDKDIPETFNKLREKYKRANFEKEKYEAKQKLELAKKIYEATLEQYKKKYEVIIGEGHSETKVWDIANVL